MKGSFVVATKSRQVPVTAPCSRARACRMVRRGMNEFWPDIVKMRCSKANAPISMTVGVTHILRRIDGEWYHLTPIALTPIGG